MFLNAYISRIKASRRREQIARLLQAEKDKTARLRAERRDVRKKLREQPNRRSVALDRIEKWVGQASFVASARMFQRVYTQPKHDQRAGNEPGFPWPVIDDREFLHRLAKSHGISPSHRAEQCTSVTVHAFKGVIGFVEVQHSGGTHFVSCDGESAGEIHARATNQVCDLPHNFIDITSGSAKLSEKVPFPYVQLQWERKEDLLVLSAIDAAPRRIPVLVPAWDEDLGVLLERAHGRVLLAAYEKGLLDNQTPSGPFRYEEEV